MSTLTAYSPIKPMPLIFANIIVEIELVLAKPEDLKEFHQYGQNGETEMKLRLGMIYWLKSQFTNRIEPTPRIITNNDEQFQLKEWLDREMIYIAKNPFG